MLRTQHVTPALCGPVLPCVIEQQWDPDTGAIISERFLQKCDRHARHSDGFASAAVVDESQRFNAVIGALQRRGIDHDAGALLAGSRINDAGDLEVPAAGLGVKGPFDRTVLT